MMNKVNLYHMIMIFISKYEFKMSSNVSVKHVIMVKICTYPLLAVPGSVEIFVSIGHFGIRIQDLKKGYYQD